MRWSLALAATMLVGCGTKEPEVITLRVSTWSGAGEDSEFDRLVEQNYREFEAANPGVRIVTENMPIDYVPKMMMSKIAGVTPDITALDASSAALFVKNGILQDLTPFLEKDKDLKKSDFFENTLKAGETDGKLFAIPRDFTPMVMYYNKDIFDKANVPYPRNGWSFDDFKQTAKKLSANGKSGFVLTTWMPGWVMWLWNNNGTVLSPDGTQATGHLDSPQNEETLTFLKSLVDEGIAPKLSEVAATGVDPFANGDAAIAVSGHWALLGYKNAKKLNIDRLGIVSMPTNIGKSQTVYYATGLGIGANCKHPDLAWKFIKHNSTFKFQLQYQASGVAVCARKDVAEERAKDPIEKDFLTIVPSARPPSGASVEGYAFVEQQGMKMLESVLNGSQTPKKALQNMAARVDKEFAK